MKFSIVAIILAFAASTILAQEFNQSAPFNLIVFSDNTTINGSALIACHEGAAIEGLCLGLSTASQFQFNTTSNVFVQNETLGAPGLVTYELQGGNFNVSEPLGLYYNQASNVALPLFDPSNEFAVYMSFDIDDYLNIQSYIDDRVPPPYDGAETAYYRWYVCETYFTGYTYMTLAWVMGQYPPQNPTCTKVGVKRVFV